MCCEGAVQRSLPGGSWDLVTGSLQLQKQNEKCFTNENNLSWVPETLPKGSDVEWEWDSALKVAWKFILVFLGGFFSWYGCSHPSISINVHVLEGGREPENTQRENCSERQLYEHLLQIQGRAAVNHENTEKIQTPKTSTQAVNSANQTAEMSFMGLRFSSAELNFCKTRN